MTLMSKVLIDVWFRNFTLTGKNGNTATSFKAFMRHKIALYSFTVDLYDLHIPVFA